MQFVDFIPLVLKWVPMPSTDSLKKSQILKEFSWNDYNQKELYWLAICESFKKIFPNFYSQETIFTNEFFLDFVTHTQELNPNKIVVHCEKDAYCFFPEEIFNIFHNDLCRSNTILFEETSFLPNHIIHNIVWSLQRSFRLPVNPWSNKTFTLPQIKEIVSQLLLFNLEPPVAKMPEVILFLQQADAQLLSEETNLQTYFEKQGLVFKEHIKSYWICSCSCKNEMNYTSERLQYNGDCKPIGRNKPFKCKGCHKNKSKYCKHDCDNYSLWKSNHLPMSSLNMYYFDVGTT